MRGRDPRAGEFFLFVALPAIVQSALLLWSVWSNA